MNLCGFKRVCQLDHGFECCRVCRFLLPRVGQFGLCACRLLANEYDFQESPMHIRLSEEGPGPARFLGRGRRIGCLSATLPFVALSLTNFHSPSASSREGAGRPKMPVRLPLCLSTQWPSQNCAKNWLLASVEMTQGMPKYECVGWRSSNSMWM